MRFKDQVVVVTGSGQGMGKETALRFAKEGAKIVVAEVRPETANETVREIREGGGVATCSITDVAQKASVEAMTAETIEEFGKIDVLVNSAGVFMFDVPVVDTPEDRWEWMFSVNLKGVFLTSKAVGREMAGRKQGAIVNFSSVSSFGGLAGTAAYAASKAAVNSLTKTMALEMGEHGVRVNAVAPGFIETEINREQIADERVREGFVRYIPGGRIGEPEDVAKVVLFLASDDAGYMNGSIVTIDAGWTSQFPHPKL